MLTNYVNNLSNLVNQFVPIYQTILDTINNPNEISNIYQLLDNITVALQIYFIPIHIIFINNLPLAKGVFFLAKNRQKKITCKIAGY